MLVTQIEDLDKNRKKVYLDDQFAFVLYKGELHTYRIAEGQELSEASYHQIVGELLPRRAKLRAMNLLRSKDYTRKQLMEKLRQGHFSEEIIEETLNYAASYHYIDDLRYAMNYLDGYARSRSVRRMEQDLQQKGIDRQVLTEALQRWEEKTGGQDEQSMIYALLRKKHYDPADRDRKERQRIYAFLLRRGYSPESVEAAMRSYEP